MKKFLMILFLVLLIPTMMFAETESATFTLTVAITETPVNTGIRIVAGDISPYITSDTTFDTKFSTSSTTAEITHSDGFVSGNIEGYFTVLVRRITAVPLGVTITGTSLQKAGTSSYLGFALEKIGSTSEVVFTSIGSSAPMTFPTITYGADDLYGGIIRDVQVFKYTVPEDNTVPIGNYVLNLTFSIETP